MAVIYRDAADADWKTNPEAYAIERSIVDDRTMLKLKLAKGGGTAISIMPATAENIKSIKAYK